MSDSIKALTLFGSDYISRKIIRYAIGMVIMWAVVFSYNWPAAFLVIIIGNSFLLGSRPTLKFAFDYVWKFTLSLLIAIALSNLFLNVYIIYIPLIGLIMFHIYYAESSVLSPVLKLAMCIMNMLVPFMSLKSLELGSTLGSLLVIGSIGALLITFLLFAIFPDIETPPLQVNAPPPVPKPTERERFNVALKGVAILYAILIPFFFFNKQSDALFLVYVSLFASIPGFAKDLSIGKHMIKSNIAGGIVAFVVYQTVILVPMLTFLLLLVFGLTLWYGHQLITDGKYAATIKSGYATVIFVLGVSLNNNAFDVGGKATERVLHIISAVIYLVISFRLLEKLFPQTDKSIIK